MPFCLPSTAQEVQAFWNRRSHRIKSWYLSQKRPGDVVISGSPHFLVAPMMRRLGVGCTIATQVHPDTGCQNGPTCLGAEKVARFQRLFAAAPVQVFYSDHLSDAPMARLAQRAFLVKGEGLLPWPPGTL